MFIPYKAVYVGHLLTPQNIPLHGKTATIHFKYETVPLNDNKLQCVVHATFDDPTLGRYHCFTHRFREEEFQQIQEDTK